MNLREICLHVKIWNTHAFWGRRAVARCMSLWYTWSRYGRTCAFLSGPTLDFDRSDFPSSMMRSVATSKNQEIRSRFSCLAALFSRLNRGFMNLSCSGNCLHWRQLGKGRKNGDTLCEHVIKGIICIVGRSYVHRDFLVGKLFVCCNDIHVDCLSLYIAVRCPAGYWWHGQ